MKTAQASMEFLFAIGTIFFIFTFILAFTVAKKTEINQLEKIVITKNECIKLSNLIINAFINGNETSVESKLIFDSSVYPDSRLIGIDNDFVTCTIPTNQISQVGSLTRGDILIENKNNFIVVKNA